MAKGKIVVSKEWTPAERAAVAAAIRASIVARTQKEPLWVRNGSMPWHMNSIRYQADKRHLELCLLVVLQAAADGIEDNRSNFTDWIE